VYGVQILAGLLTPTSGTVNVNGPKSFVFQNPDHQVFIFCLKYYVKVLFCASSRNSRSEELNVENRTVNITVPNCIENRRDG